MWDAEASIPRSHTLDILDTAGNIGALMETSTNEKIALACLTAIVGQEVGGNGILSNNFHPGSKKEHLMIFHEGSAVVHYGLHNRNEQRIATHCAGHLISNVTLLNDSISTSGRLSCCVKHRDSRKASMNATSRAF